MKYKNSQRAKLGSMLSMDEFSAKKNSICRSFSSDVVDGRSFLICINVSTWLCNVLTHLQGGGFCLPENVAIACSHADEKIKFCIVLPPV